MDKFKIISGVLAISLIIILIINASSENSQYILFHVHYENNTFTIINKTIESGNFNQQIEDKDYKFVLLLNNNTLYQTYFNPEFLFTDAEINNETIGSLIILNKTDFFISAPNLENIDKIQIINKDQILLEEDYSLAKPCRIK